MKDTVYSFRAELQEDALVYLLSVCDMAKLHHCSVRVDQFTTCPDTGEAGVEFSSTFDLMTLRRIAAIGDGLHVIDDTLRDVSLTDNSMERRYGIDAYNNEHKDLCICWIPDDIELYLSSAAPYYLVNEITSRIGRGGRGRLWIDSSFPNIDVSKWFENYPKTQLAECGGVVMKREDRRFLPGHTDLVITDTNLVLLK